MAVNGVEIRVGQKWRTRGGLVVRVVDNDGHPEHPWDTEAEVGTLPRFNSSVGDNGRVWSGKCEEAEGDLIELIEDAPQAQPLHVESIVASGGGKLARATNYYQVEVATPIDPASTPYVAECADIIEALNMTFNEGEAFKAIWRLAAARQGCGKPGNKPEYDADKAAHYGARIAAQTRKGGAK